jgi:hypothetical protein
MQNSDKTYRNSKELAQVKNPGWAFIGILVLVLAPFYLIGCASPPEEQLAAAETALDEARQAEADVYSSEQYQEAQEDLQAAQAAIEAENEKSSFSRDYAQAESLLEQALNKAQQARDSAPVQKQQARTDAESAQFEAENAIENARQELDNAPRGKGARADLEALNRDLLQAEASLEVALQDFQAENSLESLNEFNTAKERALRISEEVANARR